MLDPALLRSALAETAARLQATRGFELDVAALEALEAERKQIQSRTQELQNLRNTRSKAIGMAKGKGEDVAALMAEVAGLGDELKASELPPGEITRAIDAIAAGIPNIPHERRAGRQDETDNVEAPRWGTPREFDFRRKDHVELGARDGWLDGDTAAKLSGARFTVLRGELARLHRALAQFMLDLHTREHGYLEVQRAADRQRRQHARHRPAAEVRGRPVRDRGGRAKRYLIPTAEVSLTNLVRDEIVEDRRCRCA